MLPGLFVDSVLVEHCPDAYGVVVTHIDGWRVVFSGDTRPCKALAEAGQGADIVIHEATFEDDKQQDAEDKAHATTSEAIDTGKEYVRTLVRNNNEADNTTRSL